MLKFSEKFDESQVLKHFTLRFSSTAGRSSFKEKGNFTPSSISLHSMR